MCRHHFLLMSWLFVSPTVCCGAEELKAPPDFEVSLYAGDDLAHDIFSMTKSTQSLMPVGLLNDVTAGELADLYAYLQTIQKK